jgi:hypothetical protein
MFILTTNLRFISVLLLHLVALITLALQLEVEAVHMLGKSRGTLALISLITDESNKNWQSATDC